ncbi:MAG: methyltransferase domain-containing protein [Chitinivibrionales bacterium]|nr:methyltransferase domain-containing protein [Chitinivibrionales bacterium]
MLFVKQFSDPSIIEIGCGVGQFAQYLYDEGFRNYRGMDFSPHAIELARKRAKQDFFQADATNARSFPEHYSLAVSLETLEHIDNDLDVLRNIRSGIPLIFSLPKFDCEGHVRCFKKRKAIKRRYLSCLDIKRIVDINRWHVGWGIVNHIRPGLLQRLFGKRKLTF